MILIVGGEGSGKKSFARSLGYGDSDMSELIAEERPVLLHLEQAVFQHAAEADTMLPLLLKKEIVLCSEVGSGIIPIDAQARIGREAVGRICIALAQQADCVVRMVCGIPTAIKGTLPGSRTGKEGKAYVVSK